MAALKLNLFNDIIDVDAAETVDVWVDWYNAPLSFPASWPVSKNLCDPLPADVVPNPTTLDLVLTAFNELFV